MVTSAVRKKPYSRAEPAARKAATAAGNGRSKAWTPPASTSLPGLLVDGSDREFRTFVKNQNRMSLKLLELRERFGGLIGISAPQYGILMEIAHAPQAAGIGISALAEQLGVTVPFIVTEVGRMVRDGLLEKHPNPVDRRGVLVTLSAQGRTSVERLAPRLREANDMLFGALSTRELTLYRSMIDRMMHSADAALRLMHPKFSQIDD